MTIDHIRYDILAQEALRGVVRTVLADAAKRGLLGDHHFKISKHVASGRTRTAITMLSDDDRTREIARMLGGEKITRVTLEHARELLKK